MEIDLKSVLSGPFLTNGLSCSGAVVILGSIPTSHFLPGTEFFGFANQEKGHKGSQSEQSVVAASDSPIMAFQVHPRIFMLSEPGCTALLLPRPISPHTISID